MNAYTIITGGLGGLGSAFALECARQGRHIVLVDQYQAGNDLVDYLQNHFPIKVHYFVCDLSKANSRTELLEQLTDLKCSFNGLINIVGQEMEGSFINRTRDEALYMVGLNIEAMIDLTLAALLQRDKDERFYLINVASLGGFFPMPYKSLYASAKRMIIHFSLGLREEIKSFGNVTVLCPGGLPTNAEAMKKIFLQGFWGKMTANDVGAVVRKTMKKVKRNIPLYIPGLQNRLLVGLSHLMPEAWIGAYLARRWGQKQADLDVWRLGTFPKSEK